MNVKSQIQAEYVKKWLENDSVGTAIAPTGVGKTKIGIDCINTLEEGSKVLIIVPTTRLKTTEWPQELKTWLNKKAEISIECIQTACKYKERHYDLVVVDEVHTTLSKSYRKFYQNNTYDKLICLTATKPENREYRAYLYNMAPVIKEMSIESAVKLNLIAPFIVHNVPVDFTQEERELYTKYQKTIRYSTFKMGARFNAWAVANKWKESEDPNKRGIAFSYLGSIRGRQNLLYNASQKVKAVKDIIDLHPGEKGVVFSESIKFAEAVGEEIGNESVVFHSKQSLKYRDEQIAWFNDGRTKARVISSAKALNAGMNIPQISFGVLASGSSKELPFTQRIGRTLRIVEGKVADFYNLFIPKSQEETWLKKRIDKVSSNRVIVYPSWEEFLEIQRSKI